MKNAYITPITAFALVKHAFRYVMRRRTSAPGQHAVHPGSALPSDFFGICVATSEDPACDDYVLACLAELGLRAVRVDFSYESEGAFTERLIARLVDADIKVCLHLVQPFSEARHMDDVRVHVRWREFVERVLLRWGESLDMVEVGSTCNRRKWAGYTLQSFVTAWAIAAKVAAHHAVKLAGPNVTDFEPQYNIGILGMIKAREALPAVHTDNLFVERATEPEAYDHKILGHRLAPCIKYDFLKKARVIANISAFYGIPETMVTHVAWSRRRIQRLLADTDNKQADYLSRYLCLAVASGVLDRVYWGPLIGQREGPIDDGTDEYPEHQHVTYYGQANGQVDTYRICPAFYAYQTIIKILSSTQSARACVSNPHLHIYEYTTGDTVVHAVWTMNGFAARALDCYSENALNAAVVTRRDGGRQEGPPTLFGESPVFLEWAADAEVHVSEGAACLPNQRIHYHAPEGPPSPVRAGCWNGLVCAGLGTSPADIDALLPERLEEAPNRKVLRDGRNCVWLMDDPMAPAGRASTPIVVKRFKPKAIHKKIIERWRPSKSLRSWNGASELLRRGIATPKPVAFFQQNTNSTLSENYYICEAFSGDDSVRKAFYAFRRGEEDYKGVPEHEFYNDLGAFLTTMHGRGVYFRDLSAGNIMLRIGPERHVEFTLIDTARARFFVRGVSLIKRLADLKRVCHPLPWTERDHLLRIYMAKCGWGYCWWMRVPLLAYDLKHKIKPFLRRKKKRSS